MPFGDKVDNVVDRQFKTAATAQWTFPRISTGVCRVFTELGFAESRMCQPPSEHIRNDDLELTY